MVAAGHRKVPRGTNPDNFVTTSDHNRKNRNKQRNNKNKNMRAEHSRGNGQERQKNLIEAVVFSADDFSPRHSQLLCGSLHCVDYCASDLDAAPFDDANDSTNAYANANGMFGIQRKRLISYENTNDLTRKLDAFFHRKGRGPLSLDAAREIRNPMAECNYNLRGHDRIIVDVDECEYEYDDASTRSTCPSTSPSSTRGDCYRSCSYSYTSERQGNRIHCSTRAAPNNSSKPSTSTRPSEFPRSSGDDDDDDGSLPDFLKGVEFKKSCRKQRGKKLEVIALPFSPPPQLQPVVATCHSSSPSAFHSNVNVNSNDVSFARNCGYTTSATRRNTSNVVTDRQNGIEMAMGGSRVDRQRLEKGPGQNSNHKRHLCCLRRLGRRAKKWWKKLHTIRRRG